ncbi:cadherin-like beta sandwich domain-containing protein [Ureibacillus sp. NPDC094379]
MNSRGMANKSFIFILIFCMVFSTFSGFDLAKVNASGVNSKIVNMGEELSLSPNDLGYTDDYSCLYIDSIPGNGSLLGNGSAINEVQPGFVFKKSDLDDVTKTLKFRSSKEGSYSFQVSWQSNCNGGKTSPSTGPITITISVVNGPPTNINLINSNVPAGYSGIRVGYITSQDYYLDTNSFSIVSNPNDMFEISSMDTSKKRGMLRIKEGKTLANGETATVRIRVTDSANNTFEKDVTVTGVTPKVIKVPTGESVSWTYEGPNVRPSSYPILPEKGNAVGIFEDFEYSLLYEEVFTGDTIKYTASNEPGIDSFLLGEEYYIVEIGGQLEENDLNPSVGNNGEISISNIKTFGVTLNWAKATDDKTSYSDLEYQIYQSTTNNIDTLSNIEASGLSPLYVSKDIETFNPTGLSPNTTYYFNVIVKDAAGNKTAYSMEQVTTGSLSNNTKLSNLTLSTGQLESPFNPTITNYTAKVGSNVTSFAVTPTIEDQNATVEINGTSAASGIPFNISFDQNELTKEVRIKVTAQNGNEEIYTIDISRKQAPIGTLSINGGAMATNSLNVTLESIYDEHENITIRYSNDEVTWSDWESTRQPKPWTLPTGDGTKTVYIQLKDEYGNVSTFSDSIELDTVAPMVMGVFNGEVTKTPKIITFNEGIARLNGEPFLSGKMVNAEGIYNLVVTDKAGNTTTISFIISYNKNLSNLTLSQGTLSPVFAPSTTSYTATVGNDVSSIDITATLEDSTASLTINGESVSNGNMKTVELNVGPNPIIIVVTALNGSTKTYTITITREASSNDNLSHLTLSQGTLSPIFAPSTTSYTATVENGVSSIDVTAILEDSAASLTINGESVTSGDSKTVELNVGSNLITIVVTAQNGSTKTYTAMITRKASNNENLSNLALSQGTLSPEFASSTTSYTATLENGVSSIDVTATLEDSTASLTINGESVTSGDSTTVELNVGSNPITIVVTAQNGSTKTYTITITRKASSNDNLSNLTLSQGTLSPEFAPSTTSYTATVGNSVSRIDVTATLEENTASLVIDSDSVTSGNSTTVFLNVGENPINVTVTAQNGSTKTYTITITREASSNENLSNLTLSQGTLSPEFAPSTTNYTATVGNGVSSIDVTATLEENTASLVIDGDSVTSGNVKTALLNVGENPINVEVTAQNGSTKTYTIMITREASSNDNLSNLTLSQGTLSPEFAPGTTSYMETVGTGVSSIDVTAILEDSTASLTINGASVTSGDSKTVELNVGSNPITIVVTAQNGSTNTYTITITREASSNDNLSNLTLSQGTLSPVFAPGTTSYMATVGNGVSNIDVTSILEDSTASLTINGASVPSGNVKNVPLNVGENPISIVVTAQNGTTKTYMVNVKRNQPSSSGGGSSKPTPKPTSEQIVVDVDGNNGSNLTKTSIIRTTESDGTVKDKVTMTDVIARETVEKAKKQGNDTARIILPDKEDKVAEIKVEVPKVALDVLNKGNLKLEIVTSNAIISIPTASMDNFNKDLYFRLVPIKSQSDKKQVEDRAKNESLIQEAIGNNTVQVLGRPMEIETNMQSRQVSIVLPLTESLPTNPAERQKVLDNLGVYIEHSDGSKELIKGKVVEMQDGTEGLEFNVTKFSTFTMVYLEGWNVNSTTTTHRPYVKGYGKEFRPNAPVTRGQMAAMLAQNLNEAPATKGYNDIPSTHWAFDAVMEVKGAGIMTGVNGTTFNSSGNVTRAQMAVITYRWIENECQKDSTAFDSCSKLKNIPKANFKDVGTNHWAAEAINFMKASGFMNGYTETNTFNPNEKLTRAQAVIVLNKLFKRGPLTNVSTHSFEDVPKSHWAFGEIEEASREHDMKLDNNR